MNLGGQNGSSNPCWHDQRGEDSVGRWRGRCKRKAYWAMLKNFKNHEIMIDLISDLINLYIYNST